LFGGGSIKSVTSKRISSTKLNPREENLVASRAAESPGATSSSLSAGRGFLQATKRKEVALPAIRLKNQAHRFYTGKRTNYCVKILYLEAKY